MIELAVTRLHAAAELPGQAYPGDAGFDLVACETVTLRPGERAIVPTGIAIAIPEGYAGLVTPRSGLALHHGISVVNGPGLIDSGYRGEVQAILLNTDLRESFTIEPGMRVAQLVIVPVAAVRLVEVGELVGSARGDNGFGSSGT